MKPRSLKILRMIHTDDMSRTERRILKFDELIKYNKKLKKSNNG